MCLTWLGRDLAPCVVVPLHDQRLRRAARVRVVDHEHLDRVRLILRDLAYVRGIDGHETGCGIDRRDRLVVRVYAQVVPREERMLGERLRLRANQVIERSLDVHVEVRCRVGGSEERAADPFPLGLDRRPELAVSGWRDSKAHVELGPTPDADLDDFDARRKLELDGAEHSDHRQSVTRPLQIDAVQHVGTVATLDRVADALRVDAAFQVDACHEVLRRIRRDSWAVEADGEDKESKQRDIEAFGGTEPAGVESDQVDVASAAAFRRRIAGSRSTGISNLKPP